MRKTTLPFFLIPLALAACGLPASQITTGSVPSGNSDRGFVQTAPSKPVDDDVKDHVDGPKDDEDHGSNNGGSSDSNGDNSDEDDHKGDH